MKVGGAMSKTWRRRARAARAFFALLNDRSSAAALRLALYLALALTAAARAADPAPATMVLRNANIHAMDAARHEYSAIAWRGNEIVAVGGDADVKPWIGRATRVVDLQGKLVLPGFIDAHVHPISGSYNLGFCDLQSVNLQPAELVRAARACMAEPHPGDTGGWLQVVGISAIGVKIDRQLVDAISTARPVVLWGGDGHTAWVNSRALAVSRVDPHTADPPGGRIGHDAQGLPDGSFVDDAEALIAVPAPSVRQVVPLAQKGLALLTAAGITSMQDADATPLERGVYAELEKRGRLHQRVLIAQHAEPRYDPLALPAALLVRDRFARDPLIRADAIKLFLDGTVEYPTQSAAMLQPYLGTDGKPTAWDGGRYYRVEDLNKVVEEFDRFGFILHFHVIGDRAAREGLDALEAAMAHNGTRDRRDQFAHLELIDDADIPRMARLGVIANLQLLWALPDVWAVDATLPYVGERRHRNIYAARSLKDAGVRLAGGSDWPVSTYEPWLAMRQGVTRAYPAEGPAANRSSRMDVLYAEQRLDMDTMIAMYTIDAAYALAQEKTTGSLEPGKLADIVVLDRDITKIAPEEVAHTSVAYTIFDGRVVYQAPAGRAQ
jgi:predicted amidohydrolase YtcJ